MDSTSPPTPTDPATEREQARRQLVDTIDFVRAQIHDWKTDTMAPIERSGHTTLLADLKLTRGLTIQMTCLGTLGLIVAASALSGLYQAVTGHAATFQFAPRRRQVVDECTGRPCYSDFRDRVRRSSRVVTWARYPLLRRRAEICRRDSPFHPAVGLRDDRL